MRVSLWEFKGRKCDRVKNVLTVVRNTTMSLNGINNTNTVQDSLLIM